MIYYYKFNISCYKVKKMLINNRNKEPTIAQIGEISLTFRENRLCNTTSISSSTI